VAGVRQLRHRQLLDRLDYLRGLRRLAARMTQSELARALGLTQPSISSALKSAAKVADPRPGFSGASPYEIAQRHTAGELSRERMIDELSRWDHDEAETSDRSGTHVTGRARTRNFPGSTEDGGTGTQLELRRAVRDGLLDEDTCQLIMKRQRELGRRVEEERSDPARA